MTFEAWPIPSGYVDLEGVFTAGQAIRSGRHVYIETEGDRAELYDVTDDPYQLRNLIENPASASLVADLKKRLEQATHPRLKRTWVAQCAAPVAPLDAEQIAQRFGQNDLRLAEFDCTQSWLYPTGGASPGWVIVPEDLSAWTLNKLEPARLYSRYGRTASLPPFRIYEDDGHIAWPAPDKKQSSGARVRIAPSTMSLSQAATVMPVDLPVSFEDGLTLLGYTLDRSTLTPGETLHLETIWRVDRVPNQLLSLMAHVLAPDGSGAAVGDGLGVPIESWKPGDVFVQRHTLTLSKDAPAGTYWVQTGANWLDGGVRWRVRDNRAQGDRVLLVGLEVK